MFQISRLREACLGVCATVIGLCLPGTSLADTKSDYLANIKGKTEVPKVLADNAYSCDMLDAFASARAQVEIDGKKQAIQIYEVACKDRRGVLLRVNTAGKIWRANDCYEAEAERKVNPAAPVCVLPLNKNNHRWAEPIVKPLFPKCEVHAVVFIGKAPGNTGTIYEIACKGGYSGGSGFYTLSPDPLVSKPLGYISCLRALNASPKCTRTDDKGAINNYKPLAEAAAKGCAPANARFMGGVKDKVYYEIICASDANFVLVTDGFDQFQTALTCQDAEKYGAKCQFGGKTPDLLATDTSRSGGGQAKTDPGRYNATLAKLGKVCTINTINLIATDTAGKRELIEFKCQEMPYGLAGYLPTADSAAKADLTDCFIATLRKFDCRFYPVKAQKKRIEELAGESPAIKADCVVADIRYIGATADGDLTVEIACQNKRGYIAVITAARGQISKALPCRIAANRPDWEKCTLPDNGTFVG